jgi:NAD+ kinase
MKTAGIIFNPDKKRARDEMKRLKALIARKKCKAVVIPSDMKRLPHLDFAITLGGDGTMLKASRLLAPLGIPVLGVNMGSLGFLAETTPEEAPAVISDILSDNYMIEERMMIEININSKAGKTREFALNDITIHSGLSGRVININANINDEFLANYLGDGVIISTPTGSTAYSLAAMGPIVHPHLSLFIITPICPHTLTQRPLIVSTNHALSFVADVRNSKEKPLVSVDGQLNYPLGDGDTIAISASNNPLQLIINPKRKYFQILRAKLKWGERGENATKLTD